MCPQVRVPRLHVTRKDATCFLKRARVALAFARTYVHPPHLIRWPTVQEVSPQKKGLPKRPTPHPQTHPPTPPPRPAKTTTTTTRKPTNTNGLLKGVERMLRFHSQHSPPPEPHAKPKNPTENRCDLGGAEDLLVQLVLSFSNEKKRRLPFG